MLFRSVSQSRYALANNTLVPIPLYILYQDQTAELNKITNRIGRFTNDLKLTNTYNASIPKLSQLLSPNNTPNNILINMTNYATLKKKNNISGTINLLNLTIIQNTLTKLYATHEQILSIIYQITNITDIIHKSSNPNETTTTQNIKNQFTSLHIKNIQNKITRFTHNLIHIIVKITIKSQ